MTSLIDSLGPSDDIELDSRLFYFPTCYLDPWTNAAVDDYCAKITKKKWDPEFVAELNGDGLVRGFVEKPRSERWINGGFFCFEPSVLDLLDGQSVLEREPLERLAAAGELRAFRHEGFWDCMDTYKDALLLNDLWAGGHAPWRTWV